MTKVLGSPSTDRVVLLQRDDPLSWQLMPVFCRRVARFCQRYGSEADVPLLLRAIEVNFTSEEPFCLGAVGLRGNRVVGHVFASVDDWFGVRFLTLVQFEIDVPGFDRHALRVAFSRILAWGKTKGCRKAQLLARDERLARYFKRVWGFKPDKILMRGEL